MPPRLPPNPLDDYELFPENMEGVVNLDVEEEEEAEAAVEEEMPVEPSTTFDRVVQFVYVCGDFLGNPLISTHVAEEFIAFADRRISDFQLARNIGRLLYNHPWLLFLFNAVLLNGISIQCIGTQLFVEGRGIREIIPVFNPTVAPANNVQT